MNNPYPIEWFAVCNFIVASATTTTTATVDSTETISFEDARAIIAQDMKTEHSTNMYSNSMSRFKRDVYESMEAPLTYETHLQQLLAFSDIIYLEKKSFYPGLQSYFDQPIESIRQDMYSNFGFSQLNQKFPVDTIMTLMNIAKDLNRGTLSRVQAEGNIFNMIINNTDQTIIRLLQCVKSMVELLPLINQEKKTAKSSNFARDTSNPASKSCSTAITINSYLASIKQTGRLTYLKFENRLRTFVPKTSNHSLYLIKLRISFCYPEGNFGRNQLLDGSISLSPLYPNLRIDLHVRIATSLHREYKLLS